MSLKQHLVQGMCVEYDTSAINHTCATASSFAAIGTATWNCSHLKTKVIEVAAASKNLVAKIMGSIDGGATYNISAVASFSVAAAAATRQTITGVYTNLQIQVHPATHGLVAKAAIKRIGVNW